MFLVISGILAVAAGWLSFVPRIIKEDERGLRVILGKPQLDALESGLHFLKFGPLEKLLKYTTKQQELLFQAREVVTRPGVTKGKISSEEEKILGKKGKGHLHGAAKLPYVDVAVYFYWPQREKDPTGENLIKSVRNAPSPDNLEAVKSFFEEAVIDAVRIVFGRHTWMFCIEKRKVLTKEIEKILQEEDSPFARAGISAEEMHVVFKEIKLPEELAQALTQPEISNLKALARENEGKGEKEYRRRVGEGEAMAREAQFSAIEKYKYGLALESLLTLREMAQKSTTWFGIPSQVYDILGNALGSGQIIEKIKGGNG